MDVILLIIQYTFSVAIIGGVLYAIIYYIDYAKHQKDKEEINLIEAKLITLKMALKVKSKVKVNAFRSLLANVITSNSEIDKAINALSGLTYENSAEFQKYFDLSRQINTVINTERKLNLKKEDTPASTSKESMTVAEQEAASFKALEEFMGPDYKNELSIIRTIKEICDTRIKLNKKIEAYNVEYKNQKKRPPLRKVEILEFSVLADINTVFKKSDVILKELHDKNNSTKNQSLAAS